MFAAQRVRSTMTMTLTLFHNLFDQYLRQTQRLFPYYTLDGPSFHYYICCLTEFAIDRFIYNNGPEWMGCFTNRGSSKTIIGMCAHRCHIAGNRFGIPYILAERCKRKYTPNKVTLLIEKTNMRRCPTPKIIRFFPAPLEYGRGMPDDK